MVERHVCDSLKNITTTKQWLKCPIRLNPHHCQICLNKFNDKSQKKQAAILIR